jgi:hypothetical protein
MGCSAVVQFYTFHTAKTKWKLSDLGQEAGQLVAAKASENKFINFM